MNRNKIYTIYQCNRYLPLHFDNKAWHSVFTSRMHSWWQRPTITFIEAIRTKDARIRNILNLETCISIVAAFFYGMFMTKLTAKDVPYHDITLNQYIDWSITTPIMLLVLLLAFCYNTGQSVSLQSLMIVLVLNYGMLGCGYLGETGMYDKLKANVIGFGFVALYGYIYMMHIHNYRIFDNNILYSAFVFFFFFMGIIRSCLLAQRRSQEHQLQCSWFVFQMFL